MVTGGVSWRGESRELAKLTLTARLKMKDTYILTRIPWTLKEGIWKAVHIFRLPAVFQWINWIGLNELHPKFPVNNNGHTPLSLQSYVSDVIVYNPLVGHLHVYAFTI